MPPPLHPPACSASHTSARACKPSWVCLRPGGSQGAAHSPAASSRDAQQFPPLACRLQEQRSPLPGTPSMNFASLPGRSLKSCSTDAIFYEPVVQEDRRGHPATRQTDKGSSLPLKSVLKQELDARGLGLTPKVAKQFTLASTAVYVAPHMMPARRSFYLHNSTGPCDRLS